MAIIGLLAVFAVPAVTSIGQARGVSEAASQVASAVELARSEAIVRQTYVWFGLQPQTNSGSLDLRLGMVYSKDGSTNTNAANLQPIGRSRLIQRAGLVDLSSVNVGTNLTSATDLSTFNSGLTFEIGAFRFENGRADPSPLGRMTLHFYDRVRNATRAPRS